MDGVTKTKKTKLIKQTTIPTKAVDPPKITQPATKKVGRAHDIILSKTIHARSTTKPLMRTGLRKPTITTKSTSQPKTMSESQKASTKVMLHNNVARARRAEAIHRLEQVKHFPNITLQNPVAGELARQLRQPRQCRPK